MKNTIFAISIIAALASCGDKDVDIPLPPPSSGSTMQLNGLISNEPGPSAGNSVFVDFSADEQTSIARESWDLGFYSGSEFKVIINSFNGASAVRVNKTDINTVTIDDIKRDTLRTGPNSAFQFYGSLNVVDDPTKANVLEKTAIASISSNDADNKVYVINRKGGDATADDANLYKIRILRKGTGYTLQYAKLSESSFKTLDISKNNDYNFQFASVLSGSIVNVEPSKADWDIVWSWTLYFTPYMQGVVLYAFPDMVFTNNVAGASAFERKYEDANIAADAFTKFNKDSVAKYTFSNDRAIIGSKWRKTAAPGVTDAGVRKNMFYVIKDPAGNLYKLKFLSFDISDGGTRGKPEIKYELIK